MTLTSLYFRLISRRTPLCIVAPVLVRKVSRSLRVLSDRGIRLAAQWDEKE